MLKCHVSISAPIDTLRLMSNGQNAEVIAAVTYRMNAPDERSMARSAMPQLMIRTPPLIELARDSLRHGGVRHCAGNKGEAATDAHTI